MIWHTALSAFSYKAARRQDELKVLDKGFGLRRGVIDRGLHAIDRLAKVLRDILNEGRRKRIVTAGNFRPCAIPQVEDCFQDIQISPVVIDIVRSTHLEMLEYFLVVDNRETLKNAMKFSISLDSRFPFSPTSLFPASQALLPSFFRCQAVYALVFLSLLMDLEWFSGRLLFITACVSSASHFLLASFVLRWSLPLITPFKSGQTEQWEMFLSLSSPLLMNNSSLSTRLRSPSWRATLCPSCCKFLYSPFIYPVNVLSKAMERIMYVKSL